VKDGEGSEKRVWNVKGGGGEKDFERWGRGGDDGDGVFSVFFFIGYRREYRKPRVGPWGKGRVRGKGIKRGKGWCFSDCGKDREGG